MEKIQFAVSAKTARLIGRENISDVDGAVIELIKNSYDADATCVFVQFNIPFPAVPKTVSFELAAEVFGENNLDVLLHYYTNSGKCLVKRNDLSLLEEDELNQLLFSQNTIIVLDNGCGMSEEILRTAWMNIGTNDKEERKVSAGGRIKTGAKGIGRFALDKLSLTTTVYTKSQEDSLKKWEIDWRQFDTAVMLAEVSASIEEIQGSYLDIAQKFAKTKIKSFDEYNWDTGTVIILHPTREVWSVSHFEKINRNLKSIFPETNESHFDVYVDNVFYSQYSFANEKFSLTESDFDYRITASFNGSDELVVNIQRNEIDTRKQKMLTSIEDQQYEFLLSDFWAREAFQTENHRRADYAKQISLSLPAQDLTKIDPTLLKAVGPFQAEFYFLKNTNGTFQIQKSVVPAKRKEVFANYSGIKLYRDGFKVRPYGEEGSGFDWLGLNERAIKSPGAVSSDGAWRVRTNQIIGAVRISKEDNPNLVDMANREGLAVNDAYKAFIKIIEKIIETFEGDRQYVFQQFALWLKEQIDSKSSTQRIIETVNREKTSNNHKKQNSDRQEKKEEDSDYSHKEYVGAVLDLKKDNERKDRALKTLMLYSSAGVMTNTFSHEISRITTNTGSRMQHLRYTVNRLVGEQGYTGNPIFDPFIIINQAERVDTLLESWLEVIMSGAEESTFDEKELNVCNAIQKILEAWKPLLQQKLINILPITIVGQSENCVCSISEIDLHIIINNFLLNSAWFLERASVVQREIKVTIKETENRLNIFLENNGPPLDGMFANNPERIFFPGESSKKSENGEGTGLGLWITKIVVDDAAGEIHPMDKKDGFGLQISLPK